MLKVLCFVVIVVVTIELNSVNGELNKKNIFIILRRCDETY